MWIGPEDLEDQKTLGGSPSCEAGRARSGCRLVRSTGSCARKERGFENVVFSGFFELLTETESSIPN